MTGIKRETGERKRVWKGMGGSKRRMKDKEGERGKEATGK